MFKKSEIICIGLGCLKDKMENFVVFPSQIFEKYLVYFWGRNKTECEISNWKDKVQNIIQILNLWRQRDSTIQGRAVVINKYYVDVKVVVFVIIFINAHMGKRFNTKRS